MPKATNPYLEIIKELENEGKLDVPGDLHQVNSDTWNFEQITALSVLATTLILLIYFRRPILLGFKIIFLFVFNWLSYLFHLGKRKNLEEIQKIKALPK
jgi:hypothetical protein